MTVVLREFILSEKKLIFCFWLWGAAEDKVKRTRGMGQQSYRLKKKRGNLSASKFVKPMLAATALSRVLRGSEANLFSLAPGSLDL